MAVPPERSAVIGRDADGLRVLHVVEKFSSGVGVAITEYTGSLPTAEHFLLYTTLPDGEQDLAQQGRFAGAYRMTGSPFRKIRSIRKVVRALRPDVVHAHSSHGGAFARLAVRRGRVRMVYTPHCYAFERRDVGRLTRAAFRAAEAVLALNTSVFAACSPRELALSAWPASRARRVLVPNVAPAAAAGSRPSVRGAPLVVGGGRLSPQKDPDFFAAAVGRLRQEIPDLRAEWLGDGEPEDRRRLEAADVEVTGWLPRTKLLSRLAEADLYLHSALWEGFPIMVAEAVALGVPTVVRAIPSFDFVPPELCLRTPDDVEIALACLRDPAAATANTRYWTRQLQGHTAQAQGQALAEVYAG